MSGEELGFNDLARLVRRGWKLIVGLGLACALAAFLAVGWLAPDTYVATAQLVVHPVAGFEAARSIELYRSLVESDAVLEAASDSLIEQGVFEGDRGLRLDRDLTVSTVSAVRSGDPVGSSFIVVRGRSEEADKAAAIANTVAEVFVEKSHSMLTSASAESESVLGAELQPTRQQLEQLEDERKQMLEDFQERGEAISIAWDREIAEAREKAETAAAAYRTETASLLQAAIGRFTSENSVSPQVRAKLLEIQGARTQLSQTPRLLTLEKALSDDTIAELVTREEGGSQGFDTTLISQEPNPLYAELSLSVLTLESELKQLAAQGELDVAGVLAELERIQLDRAAGLTALVGAADLEVRTYRRRRGWALQDLARERDTAVAEADRGILQLANLELQLGESLNQALVTRILEEAALVDLAAPAVPQRFAESRDLPLKVAAAAFLGAMLGFMIALFRSASDG